MFKLSSSAFILSSLAVAQEITQCDLKNEQFKKNENGSCNMRCPEVAKMYKKSTVRAIAAQIAKDKKIDNKKCRKITRR
jgi:hypothetical protein